MSSSLAGLFARIGSPGLRRVIVVRFVTILAVAAGGATTAYADISGPQAVAFLNAQRAAHGIPGDIVENPAWSSSCAAHMSYIERNGGSLTHNEDPGRPGYTVEGAWAGSNSVLTTGEYPASGANPFEDAPIHLMQMLAPQLAESGYANGCMVTLAGWTRTTQVPQLFSYPGDGTNGFYYEQVASEMPFVPGDFVGLPQGATTGPHLMVFFLGPGERWASRGSLRDSSVTGPDGPVDVRTVDNTTEGLGGYFPPGGMLIVADPLRPLTSYTAQTTFVPNDPLQPPVVRGWTFTTRDELRAPGCVWRLQMPRRINNRSGKVRLAWTACKSARLTVSARRAGRGRSYFKKTREISRGSSGAMRIPAGRSGDGRVRITATLRHRDTRVRHVSRTFRR